MGFTLKIHKPAHQTDAMAIRYHHAVFNVELFIHLENSKEQFEYSKWNICILKDRSRFVTLGKKYFNSPYRAPFQMITL